MLVMDAGILQWSMLRNKTLGGGGVRYSKPWSKHVLRAKDLNITMDPCFIHDRTEV